MNREQKRSLTRKLKSNGASEETAKNYVEVAQKLDAIKNNWAGEHTPPQSIQEGDLVRLNLDAIQKRQNYDKMSPRYKQFVEESNGVVFTAHVEHTNMISMQEAPQWLFWSGDLTVVRKSASAAEALEP